MKLNRILVIIFFATYAMSCEKYLDKKSDSAFTVPSTIPDLQAILDNATDMNLKTPSFGEISADDFFLLDAIYNARTEINRNAYTWTPFDYVYPNEWSVNYFPVYNANLCLQRIELVPKTTQNTLGWDNIKGSALFYRAYHFLNLAWTFSKAYDNTSAQSDLGIVLRLVSDPNIPSVRASVENTYQQIIADAKEAAVYLPDNPQHVMRPSKAAAYGLLARTYLSMRQYDSSVKYSNLSLQIKNQLVDYNTVNTGASLPFTRFNTETIFYTEMGRAYSGVFPVNAFIDTMLYATYATNDWRRAAFFTTVTGFQQFKGTYAGVNNTLFTGIATDEMYLIRAESYARTGDKDAALSDLNTLLVKRYNTTGFMPLTAVTTQEALNIILLERRKELLMRGLRWADLKRLNKEGLNIVLTRIIAGQIFTLPPNGNRYALPLPKDIIDQTGMPQNPQ
jgi:starch-binding outer membrane protein, SusD/RagB family